VVLAYDPFSLEAMTDPYPVYRELRRTAPVYRLEQYDTWALSRFEQVWEVLEDRGRFSIVEGPVFSRERLLTPNAGPPPLPDGPLTSFSMIDPPRHTRYRQALRRSFTPRRADTVAPAITDLVAADLAHVLWAVNLACLGFHVWPTLAADPDHADELRIDLDPSPGVTFPMVQEAAHEVRALLDGAGVGGLPKTTGNRGIHVYVRLQPRWTSYEVRAAAVAVARELERRRPDLVTAAWWKEERGARVFIDFNQNAPHKTIFGAWSVRARPGAQVSTPFGWDELDAIDPDVLTIATVPERLARRGDPWEGMPRQSLEPLLAMAERDRANGLPDAPWPPVYPKMPEEPPRVAPSRARKE